MLVPMPDGTYQLHPYVPMSPTPVGKASEPLRLQNPGLYTRPMAAKMALSLQTGLVGMPDLPWSRASLARTPDTRNQTSFVSALNFGTSAANLANLAHTATYTYVHTHIQTYISMYALFIYTYMLPPPLLSTHLGLLNRVFDVENLGPEMCMDEPLGYRYLSPKSFAWFWPGRQTKSNPTILPIATVSQKSQPVKGNSPGHGYNQRQT